MLKPEAVTQEIIHRLQQLRHAQGYTQQEVYDATGIHVARLEARRSNMTVATLATLCQHYQISLADFFRNL